MITNVSNKSVISEDFELCTSSFSLGMGLRFARKPRTIIFNTKKPRWNVMDMFFVKFPIDIMFLDQDKRIVDMKENFEPSTVYKPKEKNVYVIEVPVGTISSTSTRIGHVIEF